MERAVQLSEEALKAWDTLGTERRSAPPPHDRNSRDR